MREAKRGPFRYQNDDLPRSLDRIGYVLAIRRGETHADAEIRQVGMGIVAPVEFGNWLGIALAGLRPYQNAFLKVRLEQALERNEKSRAIVAMPVGIAARHNLGVIDLHFHLRVARKRSVK